VAYAGKGQQPDAGAKMIHRARNDHYHSSDQQRNKSPIPEGWRQDHPSRPGWHCAVLPDSKRQCQLRWDVPILMTFLGHDPAPIEIVRWRDRNATRICAFGVGPLIGAGACSTSMSWLPVRRRVSDVPRFPWSRVYTGAADGIWSELNRLIQLRWKGFGRSTGAPESLRNRR